MPEPAGERKPRPQRILRPPQQTDPTERRGARPPIRLSIRKSGRLELDDRHAVAPFRRLSWPEGDRVRGM